ncbi:uncharacterized protein LOC115218042 isoform X2 [Octopus sinensis]|uniref:Uncharacterized protein LOC115218042 isoform X2 n=1 Tax=Octopus sinensis TaxID=2607531 RepID=A0A7E6F1T7_9MOLL|nr:uncharacterized protein LOC115218042 isoform X2 [Octopus sinensis]
MHFDNALGKMMEFHKRLRPKRDSKVKFYQVIPKVSSVGEDLTYLERDRSITTDPTESKKRRTIKLIRTNSSWGFTLQTYGIRHKKNNEIEITTYVDYVEIDKPAWIAGMRQGDVILSVNGDSVEQATHQQLVEKIKSCARYMRLVVLFEDCCRKVELHDRYIKLKNILREKKRELKLLNEQEQNILQGLSRTDGARLSCRSSASSLDSAFDQYSLIRPCSMNNLPNICHFSYTPISCDTDANNSHGSDTSELASILERAGVDSDSDTCSNFSVAASTDTQECLSVVLSTEESACCKPKTVADNEQFSTAEEDSELELKNCSTNCLNKSLFPQSDSDPPNEHINQKDEVTRL